MRREAYFVYAGGGDATVRRGRDAVRAHGVGGPRDKVIGARVFRAVANCEVRARPIWGVSGQPSSSGDFLLGGARALEYSGER